MKRWISIILLLTMLLSMMPSSALADEEVALVLPGSIEMIAEEAFAGDGSIVSLVIPKSIQKIGERAFADCTSLREVYVGLNSTAEIARNAFEGCRDLHFNVYSNTKGEQYALAHGFDYDLLDEGSDFLNRAMKLVAKNGGSSILQSGEFASKRLIVSRRSNKLPDISAFNPVEIAREGNIFMIQFDTVDNAADCYTFLVNDEGTVFAEPDECISALDDVYASGVVDANVWQTDDPMGFDVYSSFVAANSGGGVTIAVVDSGVKRLGSYSRKLRADGINMLALQDGVGWDQDDQRHGSVIASVISDCTGNANVSILPVRVVGASGNSNPSMIGNGILYAKKMGASIIVLSMNFKESAYVTHCINEAISAGVTIVVAAGNAHRNIQNVYPANLPQVTTVSGISTSYELSADSNFGSGIDYCAPDSYIKTSAYSSSLFFGTSFAAPMIASAIALVSMDPYHTKADMDASCYLSNDTDSPANSYGTGMPRLDKLANIRVSALVIDGNLEDTLAVGEEIQLKWSVLPENATDRAATITSDNEGILEVTVKEDGSQFVKAKAAGTATLTFTSSSSGVTASKTIAVVQPVSEISISGASSKLVLGRTMKLSALVSPENATSVQVEWVSTAPNIASVNENGVVRGLSSGTVGIYARAKDGYGAQSSTVTINVVEEPDAEGVVLKINNVDVTNGVYYMRPGDIAELKATVLPEDADQTVSFTSFGNYISITSSGVITAKSSGTAYINVTSADHNASASLEVHVVVPPSQVTISGATTLNEGESAQLTAAVTPDNADDKSVTWKSSNSTVATVSSSGIVKGISAGTAIITATANGDSSVTAQVQVTVRHPFTIGLDLNKPAASTDNPSLNGVSNVVAYSSYAVGTLPSAQLNYYYFDGWFTAANGGTKISADSTIDTTGSSYTLYAHWTLHEESGWVLTSEVPANAAVTQTSYSYRESTESTSSTMSGWIGNGNYWKQTGSGSTQYASFPSTFNTSHSVYKELNGSAYSAFENTSTKREVNNSHSGYVYWHWAYNAAYANNTGRWISDRKQTAGASRNLTDYAYSYFYAFKSTTNAPTLSGFTYTWGVSAKYDSGATTYNCANCLPSGADKSATSGLNNPRFLRLDYYTSNYTDYTKYYRYYRDLSYQANNPGSGANGVTISNLTTYVKYRVK